VLARADSYVVIFDDTSDLAVIDAGLRPGAPGNRVVRHQRPDAGVGFEDIAHDAVTDRYYLLVEAAPRRAGGLMAKVSEHDGEFRHLATPGSTSRWGASTRGWRG
jgi:hypothetical protein